MNKNVSIIILNWNGWEDTIECLESIYNIKYPNYNVIIVDNCSEDNSIEKIEEYCEGKIKIESNFFEYETEYKSLRIVEHAENEFYTIKNENCQKLTLIKNDKNYGYAEGNNIGIKYAFKELNPDYIVTLNNDTVVDPFFLNELIKTAESGNEIGMLGPKIYYYYKPDLVWFAGSMAKFISCDLPTIKNYKNRTEVDVISGCIQFFKVNVLKETGFYDSSYPPGYDNLEICFRIKNHGYKILYVPESVIWHKVGTSRTKIEKNPEKYTKELNNRGLIGFKARFRMFKENSPYYYHLTQFISCFTYLPIKTAYEIIEDPTNPSTLKTILKMLVKYYLIKIRGVINVNSKKNS